MKMELSVVHFVLAASGFLLWVGGSSAAPMVCHFDSRGEAGCSQHLVWSGYNSKYVFCLKVFVVLALCVFGGKNYSLGDSWMDNACLQCTCLHPVGVGCCETWVLTQLQWFCGDCALKVSLYATHLPGCIGRWISPRGVRCGWSRLAAECPWSRLRTLVCPVSPATPCRTPATGHLG